MLFQVMLLSAAKDVANALTQLVNATKNSSGKSASDPAMETLKVTAKVSERTQRNFKYKFQEKLSLFVLLSLFQVL